MTQQEGSLEPGAEAEQGSPGVQPVEAAFPSTRQPSLRPGRRALAYTAACVAAGMIGLVIGVLLYILWLLVNHGLAAMEDPQRELGPILFITMLTIYPLLILTTCLFVWLIDRRSLISVGLVRDRWGKDLASGAGVGLGFIVVSTIIYRLAGWIRLEPQSFSWGAWVAFSLILCPLIGVTEELIFRGYLLGTLEEWRGRRVSIALTSILFWMAHIGHGQGSGVNEFLGIPYYVATGLLFALCRYATGSLWFPIGLHAAYDWAAITLSGAPVGLGSITLFRAEPTVPHWLVGPPGTGGVIDVVFYLIFTAIIYMFLYRPARKKELARIQQNQIRDTEHDNAVPSL